MDSLKTLMDKKQYDLVLKLTENSQDSLALFYRLSAMLATGKSEAALSLIKEKRQILLTKPSILMKIHIEILCMMAKFDEAYEEFDKVIRQFDLTKQILLLDEHTAALDPKTAKKVLELTDKIVKENQMTTLMVTHNMKDAITYGNRLIMFHMGHIIYDVKGEEKAKLTVEDLLKRFEDADKKVLES